MVKIQSKQRVYQDPNGKTVSIPAFHKGRNGDFMSGSADVINQAGLIVLDGMGAGGSVVMRLQMSCEEAELLQDEIRAALSQCDYVTERDELILDLWDHIRHTEGALKESGFAVDGTHAEDVRGLEERIAGANRVSTPTPKLRQLVLDLWSFIENAGSTEEFFALRELSARRSVTSSARCYSSQPRIYPSGESSAITT